jgi:glycosyltransferase involved in cell wall biosynthesis
MLAGSASALQWIAVRLAEDMAGTPEERVVATALAPGTGSRAINAAIRISFPADLVLVEPGVRVSAEWLERLRAAAFSDSIVASVAPLLLGIEALEGSDVLGEAGVLEATGVLELRERKLPDLPNHRPEASLREAARRVAEHGLGLRPRIGSVGPGCAYIRRPALELVGPLEKSLGLDRALAELALRTIALGMVHVLAEDVLVTGYTSSGGPGVDEGALEHTVSRTLAGDERGPLRRTIDNGRVALRGLSVTIDGRALTSMAGGTQTYITELVLALARTRTAVRVLVAPGLSERAAAALSSVAGIEILDYDQAIEDARPTDVVHRPQQVFTADDLAMLRMMGKRVVIGQQDLTAYHNYAYHPDLDSWRAYRRITRLALTGADQVVFSSAHALRDALAEDLVPEGRAHVVGVGAQEPEQPAQSVVPPAGLHPQEPFLLYAGADYAHKNRPFAIRLLGALRELGWAGRLILTGAHVTHGSSRAAELSLLQADPDLAASVTDLGPVDEADENWLYAHARALVHPTLYEDFGLLPLEAARVDLPCLFAPQASLGKAAGAAATLIPWDASASAEAVLPLLSNASAREAHITALRSLATPSWDEVAGQLRAVYEQALADPPAPAAPRAWIELDREEYIVQLAHDVEHHKQLARAHQDAYHALERRIGIGLPLIEEGGFLSHAQQRGLMRVASRRGLGATVLAPFGVLGRLRTGSEGEPR